MLISVFNVGQGDSILLKSHRNCCFDKNPLLIDCGPQVAKVGDRLTSKEHVVLLTHSHTDHIGGLPKIIREKNIKSLILPYYFPEVTKIAQYLGRKINRGYRRLDWRKINKLGQVRLVGEGDLLCKYIEVFNPPQSPETYFEDYDHGARDINQALSLLNELGLKLPSEEIINYQTPLVGTENEFVEEYRELAKRFVHLFFISLSTQLDNTGYEGANYLTINHLEMTANQASIVFKFSHPGGDWLFTGDADQMVFGRLIHNSSDISAKYLKVPHHGSRGNISEEILNIINPEVAIVSHKNRKFGRSKDPHPHDEVIDLLDKKKIRTYYTNDVIKNGSIIKRGSEGVYERGKLSIG